MPLAKDLLHPSPEEEKRKHKKKRLVQSPNSYFMDSPKLRVITPNSVMRHFEKNNFKLDENPLFYSSKLKHNNYVTAKESHALHADLLFEDYCISCVHKKLTYFPNSYSTKSRNKQPDNGQGLPFKVKATEKALDNYYESKQEKNLTKYRASKSKGIILCDDQNQYSNNNKKQ
eukprot:bmy_17892T0